MRIYSLYSLGQKIIVCLALGIGVACSPQHRTGEELHKHRLVPEAISYIYELSQQTSYPLFGADTTINEVRIWELISIMTPKYAMFFRHDTVYSTSFYLSNSSKIKVSGIHSQKSYLLDKTAADEESMFATHGGPYLTCHKGVDTVIDSLFKMGFAGMHSQPKEEAMQIGDGTEYIIEVRRGGFYKYVHYHNPEEFGNESARKFIRVYNFLVEGAGRRIRKRERNP